MNDETNHLGIALPAGKLRFYRRDADSQLQFVGENTIDHTPSKETIRVTTGDAFDLVGERKQTNFRTDSGDRWIDESFEIKLRNRKKDTPVEFRVVEHLYRWSNWEDHEEIGQFHQEGFANHRVPNSRQARRGTHCHLHRALFMVSQNLRLVFKTIEPIRHFMKQLVCICLSGLALTASAQLRLTNLSLTVYNQNFAVVRDTVPLDLKAGANTVIYSGATAQVEPDSVILRDPAGQHSLQILEQNYRNDPVSPELLLSLFEGKTIDFQRMRMKANTETPELIPGKIIRSGFVPGGQYQQPIIEVNGKLQFSLPGEPLFPDLGDDTVLKPAFNWLLQSDKPGKFDAEIGYVTAGLDWSASYNLVSPEKGDFVDIVGWITMHNNSGKTFENAKIKLMAGDVNKIQPPAPRPMFEWQEQQWPLTPQEPPQPSLKRPLTNSIFTILRGQRHFTTTRPNRWNLSTPRKFLLRRFMFMTPRQGIASAAA